MKYGYTNHTKKRNGKVFKHYIGNDAATRMELEVCALRELSGKVKIPELESLNKEKHQICMNFINGIHAMDLLHSDYSMQIQNLCGKALRELQEISPETLRGKVPGGGPIIVNGDFSVKNILVSQDYSKIVAVLDWEQVHLGNKLEDLCWHELVLRLNSPQASELMNAFFEGYGEIPPWKARQKGMLHRLDKIIAEAANENNSETTLFWQNKRVVAESFQE